MTEVTGGEPGGSIITANFGELKAYGQSGTNFEMVFNSGGLYVRLRHGNTYIPHLWPTDQQVDDFITVLSYYKNLKQTTGSWTTDAEA